MSRPRGLPFALIALCAVGITGCKNEIDLAVEGGGVALLFKVEAARSGGLDAMEDSVRERLALMGFEHASVSSERDNQLLVRLPGVQDQEADEVAKFLTRPTRVAFSAVDDGKAFFAGLREKLPGDGSVGVALDSYSQGLDGQAAETGYLHSSDAEKLKAFVARLEPPAGRKLWVLPARNGAQAYLLEDPPSLDRPAIVKTDTLIDEQSGVTAVSITFSDEAGAAFAALTRKNVKRRLAILVDTEIRSLPVVQSEIRGGRARIDPSPITTREETEQQARALAAGIRAWGTAGGLTLVKKQVTSAGK